jgi:hypothetical protein
VHWVKSVTTMFALAGRVPFEVLDWIIDDSLDYDCDQDDVADLWPEYDLRPRELRRVRIALGDLSLDSIPPELAQDIGSEETCVSPRLNFGVATSLHLSLWPSAEG